MKDLINFTDFQKLELKVGEIKEVSKIEKSEKLLKFQVDLGNETRQIISGIALYYPDYENLVGKQVVVLMNLESRKMMGEDSNGMLLAADIDEQNVFILSPDQKLPNGTVIR